MRRSIEERGQVKLTNAFKVHECSWCNQHIAKGTDYIHRAVRAEAKPRVFLHFKYHPRCYDEAINTQLLATQHKKDLAEAEEKIKKMQERRT